MRYKGTAAHGKNTPKLFSDFQTEDNFKINGDFSAICPELSELKYKHNELPISQFPYDMNDTFRLPMETDF